MSEAMKCTNVRTVMRPTWPVTQSSKFGPNLKALCCALNEIEGLERGGSIFLLAKARSGGWRRRAAMASMCVQSNCAKWMGVAAWGRLSESVPGEIGRRLVCL